MSRQHINAYRTHLSKLHAVSGSLNEGVVSAAFGKMLESWGRAQDLTLVNQWEGKGPRGNAIRVDGALVPGVLRIPFGYWEAKDSKDDLDREIAKKRAAGYPVDNIVYEDTREAVLVQNNVNVDRADMADDAALLKLLDRFFAFQRPEIAEFRKAARQFKADLPVILDALRNALDSADRDNPKYVAAAADFLAHAKSAINPMVAAADVREMLIQHILTEEIFTSVFDDAQFHRQNNVARRIAALEEAFFTRELRGATKERLRPYYNAIRSAAADTTDRREKQTFVKNLYEDFYKVYNPKAADRLGVVYTPGEIVRFMIRGADWLCEKHFDKCLVDAGVEILDPATGTGTFIVELLDHFAGAGPNKLRHKYTEELHANEVAILPYYVANLNIEATYAAITGQYAEFPGLVFVDTLDNTAGLGKFAGYSPDLFGSLSDENLGRIKRQNDRKISVIIGNPPYNANQQNENDNNKNRTYPRIDSRIKDTYIKASTAQKTKLYDMYARFFRWASDRLKDEGIVAFITNRSFIDSRTFDGFRKKVAEDFAEIWVVDLGGDYKDAGAAGTSNVFGIGTGVAVSFLIKRTGTKPCRAINYVAAPDEAASEKLAWLDSFDPESATWESLRPSIVGDWTQHSGGFPLDYLPLGLRSLKLGKVKGEAGSIFKLFSLGIVTNRDDWVYDADQRSLDRKVRWLMSDYGLAINDLTPWHKSDAQESRFQSANKWTRSLKGLARKRVPLVRPPIARANYRPFVSRWLAYSPQLNEVHYLNSQIFPPGSAVTNTSIVFTGPDSQKPWMTMAVDAVPDLHFVGSGAGSVELPRYRYTPSGERVDNITEWALHQFRIRYNDAPDLSKDDIFAYVYAVLHDPGYRSTYAAELRREFPRVPLYDGFARWAAWGQTLLDLHIGYEAVTPAGLTRVDVPTGKPPTPKLKSLPDTGVILLDSDTQLTGVPRAAWDYQLGSRSAIDWVLDQHKQKKIKDPTVARMFDTYRFADHKDHVIDLLARVVTVSLETVAITRAMDELRRLGSQSLP